MDTPFQGRVRILPWRNSLAHAWLRQPGIGSPLSSHGSILSESDAGFSRASSLLRRRLLLTTTENFGFERWMRTWREASSRRAYSVIRRQSKTSERLESQFRRAKTRATLSRRGGSISPLGRTDLWHAANDGYGGPPGLLPRLSHC